MGLIAHYRLDGDARDSVGDNHGVATGVSWVEGKLGKASGFDGSASFIDMGNEHNIGNKDFSIAAWVKTGVSDTQWIVTKSEASSKDCRYGMGVFNGKFRVLFAWPNNTGHIDYTSLSTLSDNNFHHVVFTLSHGNELSLYFDGVKETTFDISNRVSDNFYSDFPFRIGAYTGTGLNATSIFDGIIDDVRIYDHALSPREVRDLSLGLAYRLPMLGDLYDVARSGEAKDNGVEVLHDRWRFDGSGYVESDYYFRTYPGDSFSISLWFRTGGTGRLAEVRDNSKPGNPIVSMYAVSGFTLLVRGSNGVRRDTNTPNMGLNDNEWHHVVVVVNGGSKVYIDGELAGENKNPVDMSIDLSGIPMHIGCRNLEGAVDQYYIGDLRDYRVYATALTPAHVKELYQQKASIDSEGSVHTSLVLGPIGATPHGMRLPDVSEVGVTRGLVAWYPLIGDTLDYAGVNHAENNGAVLTVEGYEFDGVDAVIAMGGPNFSSSEPWTFSHLMNWDSESNPDTYVFYAGARGNTRGFLVKAYGEGKAFSFRDVNSSYTYFSSSAVVEGVWGVVSWVADGAGNLSLYVNGEHKGTKSANTSMWFEHLGKGYNGYLYAGLFRDVRIHNVALTPVEVAIQAKLALNSETKSAMTQSCLYTKGQIKEVIA